MSPGRLFHDCRVAPSPGKSFGRTGLTDAMPDWGCGPTVRSETGCWSSSAKYSFSAAPGSIQYGGPGIRYGEGPNTIPHTPPDDHGQKQHTLRAPQQAEHIPNNGSARSNCYRASLRGSGGPG